MKTLSINIAILAAGIAASGQNAPARFDMRVRGDFFAGFAGDEERLRRGMEVCERALQDDPQHAEALVWHGSGLA